MSLGVKKTAANSNSISNNTTNFILLPTPKSFTFFASKYFPVKVKTPITIGRREKVSFPDLELKNVEAKIDTGAYTAALHCSKIWTEEKENSSLLYFKLLDEKHPNYSQKTYCFSQFGKRKIKNSSGVFESRFTIKTPLKIGRKKIQASISLTDRGGMKYPVLIGRKLLNKRFIVDVSQLNVLEKKTK